MQIYINNKLFNRDKATNELLQLECPHHKEQTFL